jgi:hypothetical protein
MPSVATRSPGLTSNSSPICSCSIGTMSGNPPRTIVTSLLPSAKREERAAPARALALVSKKRPRMTKKITPAATSV